MQSFNPAGNAFIVFSRLNLGPDFVIVRPLSLELDIGETVEPGFVEVLVEGESCPNLQPMHQFEACAVSKTPSSAAASLERLCGLVK
jgi:hypothetical protein